jgi:hypothetical protein
MEIGDLQPRAVDDLEVNHQFPAVIINDHDADGTSASLERLSQTSPETRLVKDLNALLNITLRILAYQLKRNWNLTYGLSHSNHLTILQVKNTVLLEDRAKHCLHDNTRAWGANKAALFM